MNRTGRRCWRLLLPAVLAGIGLAAGACGGGGGSAPVNAPPASSHIAAEKAATLNWLSKTNQMWTKDNFAALDQVTAGEMRTVYQTEENQAATEKSSGRQAFQLTGLSITLPCQTSGSIFVAYASTDVFTLGQGMQPAAMVFQRSGPGWKLAAVVNQPSGSGRATWPALCRAGAGTTAQAVLPPADYAATLSTALDHAATGAPQTAAATAPFALKPFFAGTGSFTVQSATQIRQDHAGGVTLAEQFSPTASPTLALPLAGGRGYWLIGTLTQTASYSSAAGTRKTAMPDGATIASARPALVHHATDTYITTYTATDPPRSAGGTVTLDGFFGWPLTATAS
jgi:hypothetical protein